MVQVARLIPIKPLKCQLVPKASGPVPLAKPEVDRSSRTMAFHTMVVRSSHTQGDFVYLHSMFIHSIRRLFIALRLANC